LFGASKDATPNSEVGMDKAAYLERLTGSNSHEISEIWKKVDKI